MGKVFIEETNLTAIGNAIREKTGGTELLKVVDMPAQIKGIQTGGAVEDERFEQLLMKTIESCIIPDGMTSLPSYAFYMCKKLKDVDFNNVTQIESNAFYGCDGLQSIDFKNVTLLGANAFDGCMGLISLDLSSITGTAPYSNLRRCFANCQSLTTVTGYNMTEVASDMFNYCKKLANFDFSKVKTISSSAFMYCNSLGNITLPNIESIASEAFNAKGYGTTTNTNEVTIDIGANCNLIAAKAFYGWTKIKHLIIRATTPPTLSNVNAFSDSFNTVTGTASNGNYIYVPRDSLSAYWNATNWSAFVLDGSVYRAIEDYPEITGG